MKEWKIRQEIFRRTSSDKIDDWFVPGSFSVSESNLEREIVRHFKEDVAELIYPAKSFVVAIVYAHQIAENFGEDFFQVLDDENLLMGQDPYFQRYSARQEIYDAVLREIDDWWLAPPSQVQKTLSYFKQEMML